VTDLQDQSCNHSCYWQVTARPLMLLTGKCPTHSCYWQVTAPPTHATDRKVPHPLTRKTFVFYVKVAFILWNAWADYNPLIWMWYNVWSHWQVQQAADGLQLLWWIVSYVVTYTGGPAILYGHHSHLTEVCVKPWRRNSKLKLITFSSE
jgi:hypothetical protein